MEAPEEDEDVFLGGDLVRGRPSASPASATALRQALLPACPACCVACQHARLVRRTQPDDELLGEAGKNWPRPAPPPLNATQDSLGAPGPGAGRVVSNACCAA